MKYFVVVILVLFASSRSIGQVNNFIQLKGSARDSTTKQSLPYVTVALRQSGSIKIVKSALTQTDGSFRIIVPQVREKSFQLSFSYVGYKTQLLDVSLDKAVCDLGDILLAEGPNALQSVAVVSSKPLIKQEIDRLAYDVQADPQAKGQNALELLHKVPLVSVDGNEQIQLQGSSDYKIFINGKPSPLIDSNPKDVLRSMSADIIVRIEVITTPPAKYDSEGLAGIINIVTVKKTYDGYNGTLSSRYNYPFGPNLNLTTTSKQGKFGVSIYAGGNYLPSAPNIVENHRETYTGTPSILSQIGSNSNRGTSLNTSFTVTYEIDSLHLLTGTLNYYHGHYIGYYYPASLYYAPGGVIFRSYDLASNGHLDNTTADAGINYEVGFKKYKGRLLTLSYRYTDYQNLIATIITAQNRFNYTDPDLQQQDTAASVEHTVQMDYVHPAKALTIEAGVKSIWRESTSQAQGSLFTTPLSTFVADPRSTNDFSYDQDIFSLYNSYKVKLGKLTFQGGVRAEFTRVNGDFASQHTVLHTNYANIVPSLSVLLNLKNNNSLTLGVTNRIQRPGITQLNPYVDQSNPEIITTGNPKLSPVTSHLFELSYNKVSKGSLNWRF